MKKIIIIFFLTQSIYGSGQISFRNLSLLSPDSAVLYIGIANQVKPVGLKQWTMAHIVCSGGRSLGVEKDGAAAVFPTSQGTDTLKLFVDGKLVYRKEFSVRTLPLPQTRFGNMGDTTVSLAVIRRSDRLSVVLPDCLARLNFQVVRFDLTIYDMENGNVEDYEVKGDRLSPEIMKRIERLKSGDRLHFVPRWVQGPDDGRYGPVEVVVR